jgi:hypothetical protein
VVFGYGVIDADAIGPTLAAMRRALRGGASSRSKPPKK